MPISHHLQREQTASTTSQTTGTAKHVTAAHHDVGLARQAVIKVFVR